MIVFANTIKRIIRQPVNWVFVLLFPVIFALLLPASVGGGVVPADDATAGMRFGVTDQDNTILSQALVQQLKSRYTVDTLIEEDISAALTDSEVPWVLLIREGYERDILAGRAPALEGYSLTISDVSALGNVSAQNIARALLLLGSNDSSVLEAWRAASRVSVSVIPADNWQQTAFWFGFYGFVAIFTAFFIIRTLVEDKRRGMPDRLNVLPQSTRHILVYSTLAAFIVTEVTVALLVLVLRLMSGAIPNMGFLFLLLSLYNLFSVSMVLAIVTILRDQGSVPAVLSMVATIFAMLGGLFWPLDVVPDFMQKLAWVSPGYWLSRGILNIREITFDGFGLPVLFLAAFVAAALLLGGWKRVQAAD